MDSLNDGPTRWSKKFSDRFSRFDTIPAVTVRDRPMVAMVTVVNGEQ